MAEFLRANAPARVSTVIERLQHNNMQAQYIPRREDVAETIEGLLHKGDKIAVGCSATLEESNVLDLLHNGDYGFIDRYEVGHSDAEQKHKFMEAFGADPFCARKCHYNRCEIYQVDGLSN